MCKKCNQTKCCCNDKVEEINKTYIIPEQGAPGDKGDKFVMLFAVNSSGTTPPPITNVSNPAGWSTQPPALDIDEYRWYVTGWVNFDGTVLVVNWSTPVSDTLITYPFGAQYIDEIVD